ncbi:hypothetical protein RCIA151 [Methanocella arvoryzae MRE50]|uniref:Uncharacterized protein n=1 Tax=Methanocella arvoryzae (strain DSM 22066 / NBRC 105507 / MRE50) TaxID=351160 RepID=Q0W3B5_METAR|nr:hypothetical protein RCIA151 [Methanocella arvoryzae MRE50]
MPPKPPCCPACAHVHYKVRGWGVPGGPGDFSSWEVREVRRSGRRKVSARRVWEGKPAVGNRLENACGCRRSTGEYPGKGTVQNVLAKSQVMIGALIRHK